MLRIILKALTLQTKLGNIDKGYSVRTRKVFESWHIALA